MLSVLPSVASLGQSVNRGRVGMLVQLWASHAFVNGLFLEVFYFNLHVSSLSNGSGELDHLLEPPHSLLAHPVSCAHLIRPMMS